nr:unnamed protein product [Callosobruchus analis]
MENELKALRIRRGGIKSRLTIFTNLSKLDDEDIASVNTIELKNRISRAESLLDEFNAIQVDILTITADLDQELVEREEFENTYYSSIAKATLVLRSLDDSNSERSFARSRSSKIEFSQESDNTGGGGRSKHAYIKCRRVGRCQIASYQYAYLFWGRRRVMNFR